MNWRLVNALGRGPLAVMRVVPRLIAALTASLVCISAALAQTAEKDAAVDLVETIYSFHKGFLQVGMPGVSQVPDIRKRFFTAQAAEDLKTIAGTFDPFIGETHGEILAVRVNALPVAYATDGTIQVVAAVQSGTAVRIIEFTVVGNRPADLRIAGIAGSNWTLRDRASTAGQSVDPEDPPQQAESPQTTAITSAEEKAELAAADTFETPSAPDAAASMDVFFEEPFNGSELGERWSVVGENLDKYLLENGEIYVIASGADDRFDAPDAENIFQVASPAPDTEFNLTLTGRLEAKSGFDVVWLGLRESERDYLAVQLYIETEGCGPALNLDIVNRRDIAPDKDPIDSRFRENLFNKPLLDGICYEEGRAYADRVLQALEQDGFTLRLIRRGYKYMGELEMKLPAGEDRAGGRFIYRTPALTRLQPFGHPAFMLGQWRRAKNGESVAQFTHFSVSQAGED